MAQQPPHHRGSYLAPQLEYQLGRPHRDSLHRAALFWQRPLFWKSCQGHFLAAEAETASHTPPVLTHVAHPRPPLGASVPPLTPPPPPVSIPLPSLHCPLSLSLWSSGISTAPRSHWTLGWHCDCSRERGYLRSVCFPGRRGEAGGVSRTSRGGGESGSFTGRHIRVELDLKGWGGRGDSFQGGRPDKDRSSELGCWQEWKAVTFIV